MSVFVCVALVYLSTVYLSISRGETFRNAFVKAVIGVYVYSLSIVELLSLFNQLTSFSVTAVTLIFLGIWSCILPKRYHRLFFIRLKQALKYQRRLITVVLISLFSVLFLVGCYYPPNNWDSMTYHLARVGHWIQNQTVEFYPTNIDRQLYSGPLAEYFLTLVMLIDTTDTFAFFGQWLAALGTVVVVSLIAKDVFHQNFKTQQLTALLTLLIPMSLLQAVSTQNDYVMSFFVASCFYYFFTKKYFWMGLSLALAALTKMVAIFYLSLPTLAMFIQHTLHKRYRLLVQLLLIFVLINGSHFWRNWQYYGSVLGPSEKDYRIGSFWPNFLLVNSAKNMSVHFQTPFLGWNNMIVEKVKEISRQLNTDINDEKISYGRQKYQLSPEVWDHDLAGNFFYIVLVFATIIGFLLFRNSSGLENAYFFFQLGSMSLVFALLKWQPWASRLHLTFFILFVPLISMVLKKSKLLEKVTLAVLLMVAIFFVQFNVTQPLNQLSVYPNRMKARFTKNEPIYHDYVKAMKYLADNRVAAVGFISGQDGWEYPFWYDLYQQHRQFEFKHVIDQGTSSLSTDFAPQVVVDVRSAPGSEMYQTLMVNNQHFIKIANYEAVRLWRHPDYISGVEPQP